MRSRQIPRVFGPYGSISETRCRNDHVRRLIEEHEAEDAGKRIAGVIGV